RAGSFPGRRTVEPYNAAGSVAKLSQDGASLDVGPNLSWVTGDPQGGVPSLKEGDLIFFATPTGTAIQCVTKIESPRIYFESTDPFKLNQTAAAAGTIGKITGTKMSVR